MIRTVVEYDEGLDEQNIITGGRTSWTGEQPHGVIVCHGSGTVAEDTTYSLRRMIHALGKHATIHIGDLGFQTWGSDVVIDRIDAAVTRLQSAGVETPVALLGASMGGCSALNYAHAHPSKVKCVAAVIPLVDLADARANPWLTTRWPEIDAIYGAPPAADYTGHNPVGFATDLPSDMPIHVWSSSDDGLARPATHSAFLAARPQTGFTQLGPVGHSLPAAAEPGVTGFIARHLLT